MTLAEFQEIIVNIMAIAVMLGLFTGVLLALFGRK